MTLAQHPATEVLSAVLPPELCHIICQFAAPHAAPTITGQYCLVQDHCTEQLLIGCNGDFAIQRTSGHIAGTYDHARGPAYQYIAEYSPRSNRGLMGREIVIRTSMRNDSPSRRKAARYYRQGLFGKDSTRFCAGGQMICWCDRATDRAGHGVILACRYYQKTIFTTADDPRWLAEHCAANDRDFAHSCLSPEAFLHEAVQVLMKL
jgi:hypothetical protein